MYGLGIRGGLSDPESLVHLVACPTCGGIVSALGGLGSLLQLPPALTGGGTVSGSTAGSALCWAFLLLAALAGLLTLQLSSPPLFYSGTWDVLHRGGGSGRHPSLKTSHCQHLSCPLPSTPLTPILVWATVTGGPVGKCGMLRPTMWGSPPPPSQSFNLKVKPRAQPTLTLKLFISPFTYPSAPLLKAQKRFLSPLCMRGKLPLLPWAPPFLWIVV